MVQAFNKIAIIVSTAREGDFEAEKGAAMFGFVSACSSCSTIISRGVLPFVQTSLFSLCFALLRFSFILVDILPSRH